MAGQASRENGRKGGRKKGTNAVALEKAKALLIEAYIRNIKPINAALIAKAKDGDMAAIKELHDRVYGKSLQPIGNDGDKPLIIQFDHAFTPSSKTNSE